MLRLLQPKMFQDLEQLDFWQPLLQPVLQQVGAATGAQVTGAAQAAGAQPQLLLVLWQKSLGILRQLGLLQPLLQLQLAGAGAQQVGAATGAQAAGAAQPQLLLLWWNRPALALFMPAIHASAAVIHTNFISSLLNPIGRGVSNVRDR